MYLIEEERFYRILPMGNQLKEKRIMIVIIIIIQNIIGLLSSRFMNFFLLIINIIMFLNF